MKVKCACIMFKENTRKLMCREKNIEADQQENEAIKAHIALKQEQSSCPCPRSYFQSIIWLATFKNKKLIIVNILLIISFKVVAHSAR